MPKAVVALAMTIRASRNVPLLDLILSRLYSSLGSHPHPKPETYIGAAARIDPHALLLLPAPLRCLCCHKQAALSAARPPQLALRLPPTLALALTLTITQINRTRSCPTASICPPSTAR